jgi:hypothetical protein
LEPIVGIVVSVCESWNVQEAENQEINPESTPELNSNECKQENPVRSEQLNRESPSKAHVVLIHPPDTNHTIKKELWELLMLDF